MLEVRGVSKRYGSIRALDDVSLHVEPGEIVALVGENGAGKSTLVRAIARAVLPDDGEVLIDRTPLGRSPRDAIAAGISVVWQDLALCDNLDVTANLFLGRELDRGGTLRPSAMHARAEEVFRRLAVAVPGLDRPVERLSGGQRQLVAIGRATLDEPKVLVLDEPTDRDQLALATGQPLDRSVESGDPHAEAGEHLLGPSVHGARTERSAPVDLAAEEEVGRRIEVVAQREVLPDHRDAGIDGIARGPPEGLVTDRHVTGVGQDRPSDRSHQGRLACAVLTDEGDDLPGFDAQRDVVERADGAVPLGDAPHLEHRGNRARLPTGSRCQTPCDA